MQCRGPAAALPASSSDPRFRYIHRVQGKLNWLTLIAFLLVHFSDSPWAIAYFIPTVLASTVHAFMLRFHANYLPWCPYCREDGGEEEAASPAPDDPHGRPLPQRLPSLTTRSK